MSSPNKLLLTVFTLKYLPFMHICNMLFQGLLIRATNRTLIAGYCPWELRVLHLHMIGVTFLKSELFAAFCATERGLWQINMKLIHANLITARNIIKISTIQALFTFLAETSSNLREFFSGQTRKCLLKNVFVLKVPPQKVHSFFTSEFFFFLEPGAHPSLLRLGGILKWYHLLLGWIFTTTQLVSLLS